MDSFGHLLRRQKYYVLYMQMQRIHLISTVLVLVYSFTSGLMTVFSERRGALLKTIAVLTVIASLVLLVQRDVYLPFLGRTFVPSVFLKDVFAPAEADVTTTIDVDAADGDKVLYWAAQKVGEAAGAAAGAGAGVMEDPQTAYGDFANSGLTVVRNKQAVLKFKCPTEYNVPWKVKLDRHVHYRVCCDKKGMMGPVQTIWVSCD